MGHLLHRECIRLACCKIRAHDVDGASGFARGRQWNVQLQWMPRHGMTRMSPLAWAGNDWNACSASAESRNCAAAVSLGLLELAVDTHPSRAWMVAVPACVRERSLRMAAPTRHNFTSAQSHRCTSIDVLGVVPPGRARDHSPAHAHAAPPPSLSHSRRC